MDITGRTVLLTGATGGIGHAIARALHARGGKLILTGRRAEVLEPLAGELSGTALAADLSQRADVERLIAEAGHADILVNNAALPASGPLTSFSVAEIDRALDVNLRSPLVLARHFAEALAARGSGHMVFVSSLSGMSGQGGASIYSATKFGLRGFVQGLYDDLAPSGIGVSAVFPGFIRVAGMFADAKTELPKGVGTNTPEDVAAGVVKAIERTRMEVVVAPVGMRVMTAFAAAAPKVSKRFVPDRAKQVAVDLAEGQRNKR
jgi:short-subunit dehydrogenase